MFLIGSSSASAPNSLSNDGSKPAEILSDQVRISGTSSPASGEASEHQLPDDIKDTSSPQNLENYADIGLIQDNTPAYVLSESQPQDSTELANFSVNFILLTIDSTDYILPI